MTDQEFEVLDELYFLTSYHDLLNNCGLTQAELNNVLKSLLEKGWVKCFITKDEELEDSTDIENSLQQYFYLASKSGLFAHNSNI